MELIYDLVSDGAPGPDGWTGDDFYLLSDDSLSALMALLNCAGLLERSSCHSYPETRCSRRTSSAVGHDHILPHMVQKVGFSLQRLIALVGAAWVSRCLDREIRR